MTHIISTEAAQKGFYPTPDDVAEKMLEGIDLRRVSTVLEPSAVRATSSMRLVKQQLA